MDNAAELGAQTELTGSEDLTTSQTLFGDDAGNNAGLNNEGSDAGANNNGTGNDDAGTQAGEGNENQFYGAPETYDFKDLQLPEGMQIDTKLAEKFAPLGKELNLSQQGANKLANLFAEVQKEQLAGVSEQFAEYKKQEEAARQLNYEKLLNTDKEIGGGDKAKMNAYLDVADVGYNEFASDELKQALKELHLDYHPAIIKHFYRLGKLCGNDRIANTGKPAVKTDAADILYGTEE